MRSFIDSSKISKEDILNTTVTVNVDLLDKLLSTLSDREKKVVDLRMDEMTWKAIGENIINVNTGSYGISSSNAIRLHDRAMRKMRYFVRHNRVFTEKRRHSLGNAEDHSFSLSTDIGKINSVLTKTADYPLPSHINHNSTQCNTIRHF